MNLHSHIDTRMESLARYCTSHVARGPATKRPKVFSTRATLAGVLAASLLIGIQTGECSVITYDVNLNLYDFIFGTESIKGTITTNGNTGILKATDFIAWNLTATGAIGPVTVQSPVNAGGASCLPQQCGAYATSTALYASNAFAFNNITSTGFTLADFATRGYQTPAAIRLFIDGIYGTEAIQVVTANPYGLSNRTGAFALYNPTIGTATPAAVPVPSAVWLFVSALAGFIGFNRRKPTLQAD